MALSHGKIVQSMFINPVGGLLALGLIVAPLWVGIDCIRRRDTFLRVYVRFEETMRTKSWLALLAVATMAVNWFWNIAKGL